MRLELRVTFEEFLFMDRVCVVQNDMANHDEQLLATAGESSSQRVLARHINQPFTDPGPELLLCSPEFVFVSADDASGLFCHYMNH
jgi:hypothetical protein